MLTIHPNYGGIFGKLTVLQDLIVTIRDQTTDFPNHYHKYDEFYDDGYEISLQNKLLIDKCLAQFPEMLYLPGLPSEPDPDGFDFGSEPTATLGCSHKVISTFGNGWSTGCVFQTVTSINAYLIAKGAGIGCEGFALRSFNLAMIAPQLFIGTSESFKNYYDKENRHIYRYVDITSRFPKGNLTVPDLRRLQQQAMYGLTYGEFSDEINLELKKITEKLYMLNLLNDKQFIAYAKFNNEIMIIVLQLAHLLFAGNMPFDVMNVILSHLTELTVEDCADLHKNLVKKHLEEFPDYKIRLG